MITVEQGCINGAVGAEITSIEASRGEKIRMSFYTENKHIEGQFYLTLRGTIEDFEELYNKAKQAASLVDEAF